MENSKPIKSKICLFLISVIFIFIFFSNYFFVLAYSPFYTHPDLTEEMVELFNLKNSNSNKITSAEIQWLRQGAINEDDAPRWINHFYDPTNKVGWSGKHFGTLTPEEGLKFGADFSPKPPMPSVDWVVDQESQALYGQGNQTWQKAVKSFIDGDKKSAFVALGHVLHLLEDASVPDHTRDDTHADLFGDAGSPYEKYSKEYTNSNHLTLSEDLKNSSLVGFSNIQEAIKSVAVYSNNNFFSEDTLSNKEFQLPDLGNIESKIKNIGNEKVLFLYNQQKQIYLAILNNQTKNYSTNDKFFVLPSYRDHLFPKTVLTGASVINLFFKDVEYYKQHPDKLEPIVADSKEPLATAIKNSPKRIAIKIADTASRFGADVAKTVSNTKVVINGALGFLGIQIASSNKVSSQNNSELADQPAPQNPAPAPVNPPVTIGPAKTPKPPAPAPKPTLPPAIALEILPPPPQPVAEPSAPLVAPVFPPQSKPTYILAVGYVAPTPPPVAPPAEEAQTILTEVSTSTITLDVATSTASSTVEITTTTITASSTEPVATSTISVTTTVEISTTTIATTTPEITTSTISVTTTIETPTSSSSISSSTPEIVIPEVVINEVAWAGTAATRANDEWFELYNNTDQDIDLTDWKILLSGQQMNFKKINNKIIYARSFYLFERSEDLVIRDIGADIIFTGSLNNSGEKLELFKPDGTKADEVDASAGWFAGTTTIKYRSMERIDPTKNGSDPTNWQTNQGYRLTGLNATWAHVYGSPRQPNFGYFVLESPQEDDVRTLDIKNSPYIAQYYVVPVGKTLNIDPDVNIFLPTFGSMEINGSLNALGTEDKPINFVPYQTSTAWGHLVFNNSTSTLNFVNVKQGDRITRLPQNLDGMILANNSNLTINNATIWDSEANAIGGTDSVFNISNTAIGATVKTQKTYGTYGINARGGVLNLNNVSFINLFVGLEAGCTDCSHPELHKTNMSDANFTNVDYIAEPLYWWNAVSSTSL